MTIRNRRNRNRVCGIVLMMAVLSGCAPTRVALAPDSSAAPDIYLPPVTDDYLIAVGDKLSILSYADPNLHQELTVRPDGRISVLFAGDMKVAGMKPNDLDTLLTETYANYVISPEITVVVEPAAMTVYVGGEVGRPTVIPLNGDLTVLQAVIAAGGFLPSADRQHVLLMRRGSNDMIQVSKVNLASVLESRAPDLYMRQDDTIYVTKTGIANLGDFVDAYINRIIPNAIHVQYIWTDDDGGGSTVITTTP